MIKPLPFDPPKASMNAPLIKVPVAHEGRWSSWVVQANDSQDASFIALLDQTFARMQFEREAGVIPSPLRGANIATAIIEEGSSMGFPWPNEDKDHLVSTIELYLSQVLGFDDPEARIPGNGRDSFDRAASNFKAFVKHEIRPIEVLLADAGAPDRDGDPRFQVGWGRTWNERMLYAAANRLEDRLGDLVGDTPEETMYAIWKACREDIRFVDEDENSECMLEEAVDFECFHLDGEIDRMIVTGFSTFMLDRAYELHNATPEPTVKEDHDALEPC